MEEQLRLATLARAAEALNAAEVTWAVGASALLYLEGVVDTFQDFDLLVAPPDVDTAREALVAEGARALPTAPPSPSYATACFLEFRLGEEDFDLLSDFAVRRQAAVYRYTLDAQRVARSTVIRGQRVPLCPLADWYVLYLLMPSRAKKAALIGRYLREHPLRDSRAQLSRWLSDRLPGETREAVLALYRDLT